MTPDISPQDEDTLKAYIGPHERRLWWWYDQSQPADRADLYVITNEKITVIRRFPVQTVSTYGPHTLMPISGLRVHRDGAFGRIELEQKRSIFKWNYPYNRRPALCGLENAPEVARLISKIFNIRIRRSDFTLTADFPTLPTEAAQ